MTKLNEQIYKNSPSEKYVTLFSSRFDAERRQLCYCNAGHLPPILLRNGDVKRLEEYIPGKYWPPRRKAPGLSDWRR
jgi:serine phosphatase RsbU (regulator of sigma subunit)